MKKLWILCISLFLGQVLFAQNQDSTAINFTALSAYGTVGFTPKSSKFSKGIFVEYDKSRNGKSLGFGAGVFDHYRTINLPGNGDDSIVQHTVFPMYLSMKCFFPKSVIFVQADFGFQVGTRGENTFASPYFAAGLGTVPYYLPKKIPFTLRLKYQYAHLNMSNGVNWGYSSVLLGLGFYIK